MLVGDLRGLSLWVVTTIFVVVKAALPAIVAWLPGVIYFLTLCSPAFSPVVPVSSYAFLFIPRQ